MEQQTLSMQEAIDLLVDFGDGFEVAIARQELNNESDLVLPPVTALLAARLEMSSIQDGKPGLTREQAQNALLSFGTYYALASARNQDSGGKLCELTQMLLAILTDCAARPEDVEAVFPHDECLADG